jgi:hypothetical protein
VNRATVSTSARILALVLVITFAALSGLIVGNAIQGRLGFEATTSAQVGNMVPGNRGGTRFERPSLGNYVPENLGGTQIGRQADKTDDYGIRHMATPTPAPTEPDVWTVPGLR